MEESNSETAGKLLVHLRIEDMYNKTIFDQNKTMVSKKDTVYISIGFKLKKAGPIDVTIKVTDLISGETYIEYSRI
jgi:hypothetical protein